MAPNQTRGPSSETENIYTAGPKSPDFLKSLSEPEVLGIFLPVLKGPVFSQSPSSPHRENKILEEKWVVFPLQSEKIIQKSLMRKMRTSSVFTQPIHRCARHISFAYIDMETSSFCCTYVMANKCISKPLMKTNWSQCQELRQREELPCCIFSYLNVLTILFYYISHTLCICITHPSLQPGPIPLGLFGIVRPSSAGTGTGTGTGTGRGGQSAWPPCMEHPSTPTFPECHHAHRPVPHPR